MSEPVLTDMSDHLRKLDWGERHLARLENVVDQFARSRPYTVARVGEGPHQGVVYRLRFLQDPPGEIALIAGDVISNMRAALDYQAVALTTGHKSGVSIPTLTEAVWEMPFEPGESPERTTSRSRWESFAKKVVRPEAVAILREVQPLRTGGEPSGHFLYILNTLSNRDKHRELIPVARYLKDPIVWARESPTDPLQIYPFQRDPAETAKWSNAYEHEAEIRFASAPFEVHVEGVAAVTLEINDEVGHVPITEVLRLVGTNLRRLFALLAPYNVR